MSLSYKETVLRISLVLILLMTYCPFCPGQGLTQSVYPDSAKIAKTHLICENDSLNIEGVLLKKPGKHLIQVGDTLIQVNLEQHVFKAHLDYRIICNPPQMELGLVSSGPYTILWPDQSSDKTYRCLGGQNITAVLLDTIYGCTKELSIELPQLPDLTELPTDQETEALMGNELNFELDIYREEWKIEWFPKSDFSCSDCLESVLLTELNSVSASLSHLESGCKYRLDFNILWKDGIYIPNSFSPNKDGNNDNWEFYYQENIVCASTVLIFDRWGNIVMGWKGNDYFSWDGSTRGIDPEAGVYAYYIKFKTRKGDTITKKGDLTLMR